MLRPDGSEDRSSRGATGIRVLVADDDAKVRSLFGALLRTVQGVSSVLEAEDGADAVRVGRQHRVHVAVLDFNMPQLDGVEAARMLLALQPSMHVALHSADPDALRVRASGLGLPLFDKLESDSLVEWVERQAARVNGSAGHERPSAFAPKLELSCALCGYGIISREPPAHCPMCHAIADWAVPRSTQDADAHQHATG